MKPEKVIAQKIHYFAVLKAAVAAATVFA